MNAILADGTFTPRAVTRNTSSESALKLKARGAEVVQADLWDVESLKKAMAGSEGVFGASHLTLDQTRPLLMYIYPLRLLISGTPPFFPPTPKAKLSREKTLSRLQRKSESNFSCTGKCKFVPCIVNLLTW